MSFSEDWILNLHVCFLFLSNSVCCLGVFGQNMILSSSLNCDMYHQLPSLKLTAPAPENRPCPKRKLVFQTSIFRCYVSFREGNPLKTCDICQCECWSLSHWLRGAHFQLVSGVRIHHLLVSKKKYLKKKCHRMKIPGAFF